MSRVVRESDDLIWYGHCTLWTGDWAWLKERNRGRGTIVNGRLIEIPQCPFCGSVGFQTTRAVWLRQAREWQDGTSPKAPGVRHPGYLDMILWAEKRCFPDYTALEAAWRGSETSR